MFTLPRKLWEEPFQNVKPVVNFLGLRLMPARCCFRLDKAILRFLHPTVTVIGLCFPLQSITNALKAQSAGTSRNSVCKSNIIQT